MNESDMVLLPDLATVVEDPFARYPTLMIRCDIKEPSTLQPYSRDPRAIARKAEAYLRASGIADFALFGPENEFFVFDDVSWTLKAGDSYRRLVPGFEAPVLLAYSAGNRSASIRIPFVINPHARRIEVPFPDATANPYLAMAAMLMAGFDGIQHRRLPGAPMDKDLYDLPKEEALGIPKVAGSLEIALDTLDRDRDFLKKGGVFSDDAIDAYISIKRDEARKCRQWVHPLDFERYYSL